jgi:beta-galactosidase
MKLSSQYYRPPFPDRRRWADDMRDMRAAGLQAVYLWACWGWIEPQPGRFVYDDYDELIELARQAGLQVVINTIAEIHPFWIHREVPDSAMVDHMGRTVVSSGRRECNVGLTPGGCTDHPGVRDLMGRFLGDIAGRYAGADNLYAWDLWNETRWAVHADGYVCHCPHTLREFRAWLERRHGDLDGLNAAWRRRYCSWEDVHPGKMPERLYTEMMEFQTFLTWRSAEHMAFRHGIVRAADDRHLVVAHAANPATYSGVWESEQAVSRGNDWDFTDLLDGFGASLFPNWFGWSDVEVGPRIESARSGAQDKIYWVGEVQGAGARCGWNAAVTEPVTGRRQQRWVWSTIGRGAKAVSFWCWRDEVFGREASGFGLSGDDGHAEDRLAELRRTGTVLTDNDALLDAYRPDQARIGVVFDPATYRLDWAQDGPEAGQAQPSLIGHLEALERLQLPYDVLEARHRRRLASYRFVVMPWPLIVDPDLATDLLAWVRDGGTLLVEAGLDSYDALGFHRYPEERTFAEGLGIRSVGRRPLGDGRVPFEIDGVAGVLPAATWTEPLRGADGTESTVLVRRLGAGRVVALGTFPGLAARAERSPGFESLLRTLARSAGAVPDLRCDLADGTRVQWRTGLAGDRRLLFVANDGPAVSVAFSGPPLAGVERVRDLFGDRDLTVEDGSVRLSLADEGHAVLSWSAPR